MIVKATRRSFVSASAAFAAWGMLPRSAFAGARDSRFLFVILRGALDGLSLTPPIGDRNYASLRGDLAIPATGEGAALRLDGFFGLNPNMPVLKSWWDAGQVVVMPASATPYRDRSHFDGQDVLENGTPAPNGATTGWLNRAVGLLPVAAPARGRDLFAVGPTAPLVIRGPAPVVTWAPAGLRAARGDTADRLLRLYGETDAGLMRALSESKKLDAMLDGQMSPGQTPGIAERRVFVQAAQAAGRALSRADGPRVGALAFDGWDTHFQEGPDNGRLGHLLGALDESFAAFRTEMGETWGDTVVVVATEFGRTMRENGTTGTDHGTGTTALAFGGRLKGRIIADWPGLADAALLDGRDLKPTLDLRALLQAVLIDHFEFPKKGLVETVFPGSASVKPLQDLFV